MQSKLILNTERNSFYMRNILIMSLMLPMLLFVQGACAVSPAGMASAEGKTVVKPGIEVLQERGFEGLVGRRIGLLTNPSGVDHNLRSTIDILYSAPEVNLVRLFAPEHGVRGDRYAGGTSNTVQQPVKPCACIRCSALA